MILSSFRPYVLSLLCLGLAAVPAVAGTPSGDAAPDERRTVVPDSSRTDRDTTYVLPGITVTATRMPVPGRDTPVRIRKIDRGHIDRSGASDLGELLARSSDAFVRSHGPTGLSTLSLRGTAASQSVLLLDGQPLSHPQIGHIDLSLLPAAVMESVEIVHGAASSLYGSRGLGGAVNVQTRSVDGIPAAQAETRLGAFGERGLTVTSSGRAGSVGGVGSLRYRRREGNFPYRNESLIPPRTVRRSNADRTDLSAFTRFTGPGTVDPWSVSAWFAASDRGVPGPVGGAPSPARQADRQMRVSGEASVRPFDQPVRLRGFAQHQTLRYRDSIQGLDETGRTWTASASGETAWSPGPGHRITGGLALRYARAGHPSLRADAHRPHVSAHGSGRLRWGRLLVYPSARLDGYFPDGPDQSVSLPVSPQLGLNLKPLPSLPIRWKARVGRAYRVPTLNDRYWIPGGNPELLPERGLTADTGLLLRTARLRAEITAYQSSLRHHIEWRPSGAGYWAPRNVGRTRTRGVETTLRAHGSIGPELRSALELGHTWTRALDRSDPNAPTFDEPLRYVPDHQLRARGTVHLLGAEAGVTMRYVGRRYVTTDGSRFLEPYLRADAALGGSFHWRQLRVGGTLRAENLLNSRYAVLRGYPAPPRHWTLKITVGWAPARSPTGD